MAFPMNITNPNDVSEAIPQLWAKELIVEAEKKMFWNSFEGPQGSGMPVIRKDDLTKEAGDRINIQTVSNLTGSPTTACNVLVGNEEKLDLGQFTVTPEIYRHAVALCFKTELAINFDARNVAKGRLAYWLADLVDQAMFTQAITGRTYRQFGGNGTDYASLNSGDEIDYSEMQKLYTMLNFNKALPIKMEGGQDLYCAVIHPYDAYYLKNDTSNLNWTDLNKYANVRGEMNPVFTGALGVLGGMIIKSSMNIDYQASKTRCLGFGGEALAIGYNLLADWKEQLYDYENQWGVAARVGFGVNNAVQENIVEIDFYADPVTD